MNHKVSGVVIHTISPLHPFLSQIELDCGPDLKVTKVTVGEHGTSCTFGIMNGKLTIKLDRPYGPVDTLDVAVEYFGTPARGLYFVEPAAGYSKKDAVVLDAGGVRGHEVLASMLRLSERACHERDDHHRAQTVVRSIQRRACRDGRIRTTRRRTTGR